MKERMTILQLRSTIFMQRNIGYTPDVSNQFRSLLIPTAKVYGIPQPGVPVLGVNPTAPQYGMPWRLFSKTDDGKEYNIAFQPGKIDIILALSMVMSYDDSLEKDFCKQSIEWFARILGIDESAAISRIAYAPLYAIEKNSDKDGDDIWSKLLKKPVIGGMTTQDVNLSFLLKSIEKFGSADIQMNFLHNIFDGIIQSKTSEEPRRALLFQLDLNSVPEKPLNLKKDEMAAFFNGIVDIKKQLVENVES